MDRSIPYYPVIMVCDAPVLMDAPLPEGYTSVFYTPGMEEDWCRIHIRAGHFSEKVAAMQRFQQEFAPWPELLARRMIFFLDPMGLPVGTACLWQGEDLGRPMARVHWVAVAPSQQGLGLGKTLVAKLMDIYAEESLTGGVYLTTQTASYRAINIYRRFGFVPYTGPRPEGYRVPAERYEAERRLAWEIIDGKLAEYARRRGGGPAIGGGTD